MLPSPDQLVQFIHDTPAQIVLAVTGGGSRAIADLLEVPGGSRTLLEAIVPYSPASMAEWLGGKPDDFCSAATARAMAMAGLERGRQLTQTTFPERLAGVSCTASLASDRPKRGAHRVHIALQTVGRTAVRSLQLLKERRSRVEEERLVGRLLLNCVAEACGVAERLTLDLLEGEQVESSQVDAPPEWQELLLGQRAMVVVSATAQSPKVVFSGAFNPLHQGHRRMLELAQTLCGSPIAVEISIVNVEKPPMDFMAIEQRLAQFPSDQPVCLTRAATFEEKSRLYPGATFVVGIDTLQRIISPRYYGNNPAACTAALEGIAARGNRFLVFGRDLGDGFMHLAKLDLPAPFRSLCREVPADVFREDISSTVMRNDDRGVS